MDIVLVLISSWMDVALVEHESLASMPLLALFLIDHVDVVEAKKEMRQKKLN